MLPKPNGAAWGKSDQARFMADACTRAQIEPITFHGMRHSYASLSIMAGMPLMVCAENLGHANTRMLEKNYGHLSREYMTAQVRRTAPKFGVSTTNVVPLK
jgi:integrase